MMWRMHLAVPKTRLLWVSNSRRRCTSIGCLSATGPSSARSRTPRTLKGSWRLVRGPHLDFSPSARPTAVVKLKLELSLDFRANSGDICFPVWSGPVRLAAAASGLRPDRFLPSDKKNCCPTALRVPGLVLGERLHFRHIIHRDERAHRRPNILMLQGPVISRHFG